MIEFLQGWKRSHYAGLLREDHIGEEVTLMGWVQKRRNLGSLIFVDLRDREGITQVVFDAEVSKEAFEKASDLRSEFVIAVKGKVSLRHSVNNQIPTGQVEVFVETLKVLSESELPPFHIQDEDDANERLRLKYRYLDLRKPNMQHKLRFRSKVAKIIRDYFDELGFIDIETPVLTKPTPEGARDYLVPSRVNQGKFYALPQSPQIFKQLLMVSGFDRYYQIVKCFRDEDLRADRQPEFTQVDVEMSFVEEEDIMNINEELIVQVFKKAMDIDVPRPFRRMAYKEAMEKYGSDKPDLRFGFEINNVEDLVAGCGFKVFTDAIEKGGAVQGINLKDYGQNFSRKDITALEEFAKTYGAKGLAFIKTSAEGISSPIAKFFSDEEMQTILKRFDAGANDLILFVADTKSIVNTALGALRSEAAKKLNLINPKEYNLLWVTEFPLFEYDEDSKRYVAKHHPFTSPLDSDVDLLESDPENARAKAYDLVLNGVELGGGSIRIFNPLLQSKMFRALGFTDEEAQNKFGFLLEAFKFGVPPHGGIAFGLDRLIMLLSGTENIREVIAFPKTQNASCLLTEAPSTADQKQLDELMIQSTFKG
jgi:aspartyl-tRNA synthetase